MGRTIPFVSRGFRAIRHRLSPVHRAQSGACRDGAVGFGVSLVEHNGNAGRASNQLLTPHTEYLALAADETSRHAAYRGLFAVGDEPAFLAAIRDATNGGFALVGEQLKSMLPADTQRRLERRPPGPRAKTVPQPDNVSSELELELGLRPRTG